MRVAEWVFAATAKLRELGIESPKLEAEVIAAHAHGQSRTWVMAHGEEEIAIAADALLERRLRFEPLAYIVGEREFYGRRFRVDSRVLIPRQETELIVERAIALIGYNRWSVLDWGTGSGCIAISIALECPNTIVTACDISNESLDVAVQNAERLGAPVTFVTSDGFSNLSGRMFDLVVCNPPYIATEDAVSKEVADYEPALALYAEDRGLANYKRIAQECIRHLNVGGVLLAEIGAGQSTEVQQIVSTSGLQVSAIHRDLAGHERVVEVTRI